MHERFDGWVRVLCGGSLAIAAYAHYAAHASDPDPLKAAVMPSSLMALGAVLFALWPERIAYHYQGGAGIPRWSRPTSVTRVETGSPGEPRETVATYRPSLDHLRSGFLSAVFYLLFATGIPRSWDGAWAWEILIGAAALAALSLREPKRDP